MGAAGPGRGVPRVYGVQPSARRRPSVRVYSGCALLAAVPGVAGGRRASVGRLPVAMKADVEQDRW